ncbi:MAG TPA: acyl-CoA dehydrogenase family protein [Bryobacteraceae bacterium]|nr:acyl-CoA dehydrogenase family protein [Bryobacteraceae bacterium]
MTETQQVLKNSAREFFPAECPIAEVRRLMETDTACDPALWKKIAGQGWCGILFPEEYDGLGLGMVELAAAMEEMGRALVPGPFLSGILAGAVLDAAAAPELKARYLAPLCRGELKSTLALLEETPDWDPAAVKMKALDGRKLFVPDAAVADFLIVAARTGPALALFAVDPKAPGVAISPMPAMDATRKQYAVTFSGVEGELLASGPAAESALERALDIATVALVAEMTGGMQKVLDITVEYAKTRKQFGKPIGQYQAVQMHCADMLVLTESSRSAAYYAAYAVQNKLAEARAAVSIAKAYASDAYREVGNKGIQCHGGMGFTWENDLHLYYRRAKASELAFGDAACHRERLARLVIDQPQARAAEKS